MKSGKAAKVKKVAGKQKASTSSKKSKGKQPIEKRAREPQVVSESEEFSEDEMGTEMAPGRHYTRPDESDMDAQGASTSVSHLENLSNNRRASGTMPHVPRTGHVSDKDKKKIREGLFVEFSGLYPPGVSCKTAKKYSVNLKLGIFEEVEEVEHLPLYKWYDAFLIFMSIRLEYAPLEAQGLLRHCQIVKNLINNKKDGMFYDCQFRRLKAQHPDIAWGEYMTELVDEVPLLNANYSAQRKGANPYQASQMMRQPNEVQACRFYNAPGGCRQPGCKYAHRCKRCNKFGHSQVACYSHLSNRTPRQITLPTRQQ